MKVQGSGGKEYTMGYSEKQGRWTCTCPDFVHRRSKTPGDICKHIQYYFDQKKDTNAIKDERYKSRESFNLVVDMIHEMLEKYDYTICGSWRRGAKFIKDIDVVVFIENQERLETLKEYVLMVGSIEYGGDKRITAKINDVQVDFRLFDNIKLKGSMIMHFTGSKVENIRLRKIAKEKGMTLSEYGLIKPESSVAGIIIASTEQEIYAALGEQYKEPWQR